MVRKSMLLQRENRRGAFTLMELMVVVVILAVLAGLIMPVYNSIQSRGYETKTLSNLRQMGIALLAYAGDNSYQLPNRVQPAAAGGQVPDKWPRIMQPYVQDLRIYGAPIPDVGGKTYKVTDLQKYLNNDVNNTCYIYNGGNDVQTYGTGTQPFPRLNNLTEGSQVILLGIPLPQANNFYMDFAEKNNDKILNKSAFGDGTPYMFCDGSTRTLRVSKDADNSTRPPDSGTYTDWLWLFNKDRADMIQ